MREMTLALVYEGPFGPQLARLKKVSLFSCACTLLGVPVLAVYNDEMAPTQRGRLPRVPVVLGEAMAYTHVGIEVISR